MRQRLEVALRRPSPDDRSHVSILGVSLGSGADAFRRLDRRLLDLAHANPVNSGSINAGAWVPHGEVVRCLDSFLAAGVDRVVFSGSPPAGSGR